MASTNVVYIYKEFFKDEVKPFAETSAQVLPMSSQRTIFIECGGMNIQDLQISSNERWRISTWKNAEGYNLWLKHQDIQSYIQSRDRYNQIHIVRTELIGPFTVSEVLNVSV